MHTPPPGWMLVICGSRPDGPDQAGDSEETLIVVRFVWQPAPA
jgi:hypothetical protein